jgi:hypothetical protein
MTRVIDLDIEKGIHDFLRIPYDKVGQPESVFDKDNPCEAEFKGMFTEFLFLM